MILKLLCQLYILYFFTRLVISTLNSATTKAELFFLAIFIFCFYFAGTFDEIVRIVRIVREYAQ